MFQAVERADFLGVGQFAVDAAYAHRFGSSGLSQVLGPQAGQLEGVVRGIGEAVEDRPRRLAREVASGIPLANMIPATRKAIANTMVSPGKEKRKRPGRNQPSLVGGR